MSRKHFLNNISEEFRHCFMTQPYHLFFQFEFALPWRPQETEIRPLLALVAKVVVQVLLPSVLF